MKLQHFVFCAIALAVLVGGLAFVGVPGQTIWGLIVLACPLMMLMMFMMGGGHGHGGGGDANDTHDHRPTSG